MNGSSTVNDNKLLALSDTSTSSASTSHSPESICAICGDKATGKHYGAVSCDGCKGFFRRTIRKRHSYVCRFNHKCIVDKALRNSCRSCRLDHCIRKGMKREAVQSERDRIRPSLSSPVPDDPLLDALLAAEVAARHMRSSVIIRTAVARQPATTHDVTDSMNQQLNLMVEWAKKLPEFLRLPLPAKIGLLRHFAAQHLVMCAAYRSIALGGESLWLTNETCLHKDNPKVPDMNRVAARIVDNLTVPMRRLQMNEIEYVAIKTIAFFDPLAKGVEDFSNDIEETRQKILESFERHVRTISPLRDMPLRFANLLLLLPPTLAIARDLIEDVQLAKLFGLASIDNLMEELLLPPDSTTSAPTATTTVINGTFQPPSIPPLNCYMDEPSPKECKIR